jgi:hypothetical protein
MNAKNLLGGLIAAVFAVGVSAQSGTGTFIEQPAQGQQSDRSQMEQGATTDTQGGSMNSSTDTSTGYSDTSNSSSYSSVNSANTDMHKPAQGDERLEKGPVSDGELTVWWPGMDAAAENASSGELQQ